jgi:anti-sigma regulatory factor (Ser/Thr protein kinase)
MSGAIGTVRTAPEAATRSGADRASTWPDSTRWRSLKARHAAVAEARRHANSILGGWDVPDDAADSIVLVVSELVTNAVQAYPAGAPGWVTLRLQRQDGIVLVEVADSIAAPAVPQPPAAEDDEHGRGLLIVDALAVSWDCYSVPGGKVVAAVMAVRGDRA